jgi:hypothetical protein
MVTLFLLGYFITFRTLSKRNIERNHFLPISCILIKSVPHAELYALLWVLAHVNILTFLLHFNYTINVFTLEVV